MGGGQTGGGDRNRWRRRQEARVGETCERKEQSGTEERGMTMITSCDEGAMRSGQGGETSNRYCTTTELNSLYPQISATRALVFFCHIFVALSHFIADAIKTRLHTRIYRRAAFVLCLQIRTFAALHITQPDTCDWSPFTSTVTSLLQSGGLSLHSEEVTIYFIFLNFPQLNSAVIKLHLPTTCMKDYISWPASVA